MIIHRKTHTGKSNFLYLFFIVLLIGGVAFAAESWLSGSYIFSGLSYHGVNPVVGDTVKTGGNPADSVFNNIVKKGDEFFKQKKYDDALKQYQQALTLKPNDYYVKNKITQVKNVKAELVRTEADYNKAISSADAYMKQQDYLNAKNAYQLALTIRPDDDFATAKMNEVLGLLRSQKAKNILYDVTIDNAQKFFEAKEYEKAKEQFENALKILPNEKYPKERINAIIKIMVDNQTREEMYAKSIAAADQFYKVKNWPSALTEYRKATTYKPDETYPRDRIKELETLLGLQKETDDAYDKAIAAADKKFDAGTYEDAKTGYQAASKIKPDETYPKKRIREIDDLLAARAKMTNDYQRFIDAADSLYISKNYLLAKVNYQQALKVKPNESYPKEMISKTEEMMAGQEADEKQKEEAYQQAIAMADKSLAAKEYDAAKSGYQNALTIKPGEKYPQDKIREIEAALAQLAKQKADEEARLAALADAEKKKAAEDAKYSSLVNAGDSLLKLKEYDPAKASYSGALAMRPNESYPKSKIAEIESILAEQAKKKSLDDRYNAAITAADQLLAARTYDQAKAKYQEASNLKPDEQYPKDKISEIDGILGEIAKAKALDDEYTASINKADQLFKAGSWAPAMAEYTKASGLKPAEEYPKSKIEEIKKIIASIADQKAKDELYASTLANADKLMTEKSYDAAKSAYQNASNIKPEETYPKTRIAEIDKILSDIAAQKTLDENYAASLKKADKLLSEKSYESAKTEYQNALSMKPAESYPKSKIEEIDKVIGDIAAKKALDDQYASLIKEGDTYLAEKSYDASKTKFQAALALKPDEKYPKDKIAEIDQALAEIARLKSIDDQYTAQLAAADKLFGEKSWDLAKTAYQGAVKIKPGEQYPKGKISEIDKILSDIAAVKALDEKYTATIVNADKLFLAKSWDPAKTEYQNALTLKPAETYPKGRIAEIDSTLAAIAKQKDTDEKYKAAITKADQLYQAKTYDQSRLEYVAASGLKPDEQYPKTRIAAIDKILSDQKAIEDAYAASIAAADKLFTENSFDKAKAEYLNAQNIKPGEKYPKDRVAEIDKKLGDIARQKTIDDQYNASIAKADKYLADKSYQQAKAEYTAAQGIKPNEIYPKDKIAEIDAIMAEIKEKNDAYSASITKADQLFAQKSWEDARTEYTNASQIKPEESYPKNKIAEINKTLAEIKGKKQTYDDLVARGDEQFSAKEYLNAKELYQQSLTLFPDEAYPKSRISRITTMIDSIYRVNRVFYDKAIAEGDKNFNAFIFDKAIDSYSEALGYLPMESYPKEMIAKIKKVISENAIVDVLKSSMIIPAGTEKQFTFPPVAMASRKNNYFYIKIRNLSEKPFNVLVRYGKDKQINGGAVLRNLAGDGKTYDRLISVRDQDPWYREDNNWIGLVPQGGDVEVTFIEISRSQ